MQRGLANIQTVDTSSPLVGSHSLERPPQVLCCQRRLQQRRSCVSGCMPRAAGLAAGNIGHGFTLPYGFPPRWRGHLTQYLPHRHVGNHSFSFGPSSAGSSLPSATANYYSLC
jgi:hypothetical protein